MQNILGLIGKILIILAVTLLVILSGWFLLVVLFVGAARYLYKTFAKGPVSRHNPSRQTHSSAPTGVPGSTSGDRDYDIIIDSQTQQEYHVPKRKR